MEFTVPQFIEHEAKVIGPFTFKQFIIVAIAGIICFVAYYKTPLWIFIPVCIIVGGGALAIVFVKIQGRSPLVMVANFISFIFSPKVYLWKRKIVPIRVTPRKPLKEEEKVKEQMPKRVKKSRLRELSIKIETTRR